MRKKLALVLTFSFILASCAPTAAPQTPGAPAQTPASGAADPALAPAANPVVLSLAEVHVDGFPQMVGHREFERLLNERTDGEITLDVFAGGILGGEAATLEQVQMGAISMVRIPVSLLTAVEESFNAMFLPYIWDSTEALLAAVDGEIGTFFADKLTDHGLYILAWHKPGARSFYNSVRPVYSPEDLTGLRLRVQETELMMNLVTLLGGSPTPLPFAEVYAAIQTGIVDGAENNWPSYITTSHYEVARYFTVNEHTLIPEPIVINLDVWSSLTPDQQDIVRQAAIDSSEVQRAAWAEEEIRAEQMAIDAGAVIARLSPEQRQAFSDAILPLYDDYAHLQEYIDMIRDFQAGL